MHRIDSNGASAEGLFLAGNPAASEKSTEVTPEWLNDIQESLCRLVERAGIALNKGDYDQLWRAFEYYGVAAGLKGYATKELMDLDLTPGENIVAIVTNDPVTENNWTYRKEGVSGTGSWIKAGATTAAISEANAAASALDASASADNASASEMAAADSASAAAVSEDNARTSELAAANSATSSGDSAAAAAASEVAAGNSATASGTSATAAGNSAAAAAASEANAGNSATAAGTSAAAAGASAAAAASSETAAGNSATAAANSATAAAGSASAAATSEASAASSAGVATAARDEAVAVAYNGEGSLVPGAGKIPVAGAGGTIAAGWLPAADMLYVGAAYNIVTDTWQRLGAAQGWPVGMFPGVQISPVFQALRRVALKDDGTVYKGISWLDFTKYEDGTSVDLTGGDGQIMVEYLPAYWKTDVVGDWIRVMISHLPLTGFTLHPLFDGGVTAAYAGAYEASIVNDAGTDKFCSIALDPADGVSPVYPATTRAGAWGHASLTAAAGDILSEARGAGWQQYDYLTLHWQWMLGLVGFAGCNFQAMVGNGRTSLSGGDWLNDSYIGKCGLGDANSGMFSAVQVGGSGGYSTDYSTLFGLENLWGNIWKRNVALFSDNAVYYKPEPPYDYTTVVGWTRLLDSAGVGVTLPAVSGYGGVPFSGLGLGLPVDVTGTSSTRLTDYFYANTEGLGLRVPRVGGYAAGGAGAGPFCVNALYSATYTHALVGGRLCFKKR